MDAAFPNPLRHLPPSDAGVSAYLVVANITALKVVPRSSSGTDVAFLPVESWKRVDCPLVGLQEVQAYELRTMCAFASVAKEAVAHTAPCWPLTAAGALWGLVCSEEPCLLQTYVQRFESGCPLGLQQNVPERCGDESNQGWRYC